MAKIRTGFVSNSSSASFVVNLKDITAKQLSQIVNHIDEAKEMDYNHGYQISPSDEWEVYVENDQLHGSTYMDNFDMCTFMEQIGVPSELVEWGD